MEQGRTDLALEENERIQTESARLKGVRAEEEYLEDEDIRITTVYIDTENAAKKMGKPKGIYVTLESAVMSMPEEGESRSVSEQLAKVLKKLLPEISEKMSILVAGLGNRMVTPDALGPQAVDQLCITRHMINEFGPYAYDNEKTPKVSSIVPGVMGQTGMESLEIIRGVAEQIQPDVLVVIDALAARSTRRLGRTIQVTDTGINPGSGVGNHRNKITQETMGMPVIAIGIPTVVEAVTIVNDSMAGFLAALEASETMKKLSDSWKHLKESEQKQLIRELLSPQLNNMFVTPKDIDASIKQMSFTIAEGLNIAFYNETLVS